jgi:hypothetical protein
MPRVFNRIRKQLAIDNKFFQYSRYAIGEILLVVIGILIALQVDNWNEERENKSRQHAFYRSIIVDLESDRKNIEDLSAFYKNRIDNLTWLLIRVRNPGLELDPVDFGKHTEPLYYNESAISFNATFETSKSTGTFEHFKDMELLKKLIEYYSGFENIDDVNTSTLRFIESTFEPLMATLANDFLNSETAEEVVTVGGNTNFYALLGSIEDTRVNESPKAIARFLQDSRFESYLIGDLGRSFNMIKRLKGRKEMLNGLRGEINRYLND